MKYLQKISIFKLVRCVKKKKHSFDVWYIRKSLLLCGSSVSFRFPLVIESPEKVSVGDNVSFASFVHIWGGAGVNIGDNTMIASHVAITSSSHDYKSIEMYKTLVNKPIAIGKGVWVGSHSIIFPGVTIGDGAVIGANTIVNKNVPANAIFYGSPGKVIKYRK